MKQKRASYVKDQLQKNTKNPKELWKALRNMGMSCKVSQQPKIFQFNEKKNANTFKNF